MYISASTHENNENPQPHRSDIIKLLGHTYMRQIHGSDGSREQLKPSDPRASLKLKVHFSAFAMFIADIGIITNNSDC